MKQTCSFYKTCYRTINYIYIYLVHQVILKVYEFLFELKCIFFPNVTLFLFNSLFTIHQVNKGGANRIKHTFVIFRENMSHSLLLKIKVLYWHLQFHEESLSLPLDLKVSLLNVFRLLK